MSRLNQSDTLILVPTRGEQELILNFSKNARASSVCLCGFGPVVAAMKSAYTISQVLPRNVILVGCCGSYIPEVRVGTAWLFNRVVCYGIGIGSGTNFRTATSEGWPQLGSLIQNAPAGDVLELSVPEALRPKAAGTVLTCTAASESGTDTAYRKSLFPEAAIEEMEGWGVAAACAFRSIPLTIIRGVSNRAGDRDKSNWDIPAALQAASALLDETIDATGRSR